MRRPWLLALAFWTICGIVSALQIWLSMLSHGHSLPLLLAYQILVWNGWLGIAIVVRKLVTRWPLVPPTRFAVLVHLLAACGIGVVHATYWTGLLAILKPYDAMNIRSFAGGLPGMLFYAFPLELLLYCGVVLSVYAVRALQLERSLAEARMHALELQLQPHFLFNTLNAISTLVRAARNSEAVVMIAGLSDLLRYTLDHAGQQRVTVEEESAILRRYLEIQRMRFADRLTFDIDVSDDARRATIPTLILQPLAENAIR
ncbi:MAG: sensor histidine kinase, partial [Thermoanaerobaculia bacterium]